MNMLKIAARAGETDPLIFYRPKPVRRAAALRIGQPSLVRHLFLPIRRSRIASYYVKHCVMP